MILYYSGTGNSRFAASVLSRNTGDELICMNDIMRDRIADRENARFDFASDSPFVIVCPTYCWQVPRVVQSFLRESRFTGSRKLYFFLTCGSDTRGASRYAKKLADELGFEFMGLDGVKMPENFISMFDAPERDEAQAIILAAVSKIESVGRMIAYDRRLEDTLGAVGIGAFPSEMNTAFYRHYVNDKKFRVSESCIGCGQCAEVCPLLNITLENSRPVWHGNCTQCMGCIGICPKEAISCGSRSKKRRKYYLFANGTQRR